MSTVLIKGGTVVNATGTGHADVLVDGETIAAVLNPGSRLLGVDLEQNADSVVDAAGKYVIREASTPTPTWNCRSAAPRPPTPSRPAPSCRVGRHDDDHRLRCAALRRAG